MPATANDHDISIDYMHAAFAYDPLTGARIWR
jgi:hypothetical protein